MKSRLIIFALLSVMALHCGQAGAQTDFYSLSKKEKEARAEELLQMNFDTMMLDAKTMQAYNTELKRYGMYFDKKANSETTKMVWESMGGITLTPVGLGLLIAGAPIIGSIFLVGGAYLLVDWIIALCRDRDYYKLSKDCFKKANEVIPVVSQ